MKYLIYGLKCPFTNDIHYVGKSSRGMTRPKQHMTGSHSEKIQEWVEGLTLLGYRPIVEVLEECNKENLDEREFWWINKCVSDGCILLNSHNIIAADIYLPSSYGGSLVKGFLTQLKRARKKLRYTSEEVSKAVGISRKTLYEIERGNGSVHFNSVYKVISLYDYRISLRKKYSEDDLDKMVRDFVEFCNPGMGVWDTKMYKEKQELLRIMNTIL